MNIYLLNKRDIKTMNGMWMYDSTPPAEVTTQFIQSVSIGIGFCDTITYHSFGNVINLGFAYGPYEDPFL